MMRVIKIISSDRSKLKPVNKRIIAFFICCFCLVLISIPALAQPTISSFTPAYGPTGTAGSTTITINGTGFSTTASNNIVFFGAVYKPAAAVTGTTQLTVTAPTGTKYQYLAVLNKETGLTAYAYTKAPFIPTYYNEGALEFAAFSAYTSSYSSSKPYFKIGDIDGDGKPDVVLLNTDNNSISVLLNTSSPGSVSFATNVDLATGNAPMGLEIVDLDGDGKPDIIVSNSTDQTLSFFRNTSSAGLVSFATRADMSAILPATFYPGEINVADLDGDGLPDLFFIFAGSHFQIYHNTSAVGSISFSSVLAFALNGSTLTNAVIADFDGDGKIDISLADSTSGNAYTYYNTSTGGSITFSLNSVITSIGTQPAWFAAGDLDGDGKPDLVSTNTGGGNMATLLNTSTPGNFSFATRVGNTLSASNPTCVVITDIDGDGKPDVAVSVSGDNTVKVLRNNSVAGTIRFAARRSFSTISSPQFLQFCDFDGDGKPDLAVINSSSFSVTRIVTTKSKFIPNGLPF